MRRRGEAPGGAHRLGLLQPLPLLHHLRVLDPHLLLQQQAPCLLQAPCCLLDHLLCLRGMAAGRGACLVAWQVGHGVGEGEGVRAEGSVCHSIAWLRCAAHRCRLCRQT